MHLLSKEIVFETFFRIGFLSNCRRPTLIFYCIHFRANFLMISNVLHAYESQLVLISLKAKHQRGRMGQI